MNQTNFRTVLGFTLFGMLAGPFVTSAGFVMWLVSASVGLGLGGVFYALGAFVLSRNIAIFARFGLGGGFGIGALVGALIGFGFNAARVTLDLPIGLASVLASATLTLMAWSIIRFTFGQASPQTGFQPRFSFAIAMLFTWITGLLGALFYPLFAGLLDALGFGAIAGGVAGTFLGSAVATEIRRRESQPAKR